MDANAINAIRDKLRRQAAAAAQARVELPLDWPTAHGVTVHSQAAQAAATVEMLKRRSSQSSGSAAHSPHPSTPVANLNPVVYQRRLQAMVKRINYLSQEQEQVIAEMQRVHHHLITLAPQAQGTGVPGQNLPALQWDQAITARATLDDQGNIVLTYRPVDPHQPDHEARHLAHQLRTTYSPTPGGSTQGASLWRMTKSWLGWGHRASQRILAHWPARPQRLGAPVNAPTASLSVGGAVLWVLLGLGGRMLLNGLISTVPSLGMLVVVAATAVLAYSLYRVSQAPLLDLNWVGRIVLVLGGLMIGGRW